jgi:hypothetical protein
VYRQPAHLKKPGTGAACSKACAAKLRANLNNNNYLDGSASYRKFALDSKPNLCNRCEWKVDVIGLDVHHIDRDRTNNKLGNLEIVCAGCHRVEHRTTTMEMEVQLIKGRIG